MLLQQQHGTLLQLLQHMLLVEKHLSGSGAPHAAATAALLQQYSTVTPDPRRADLEQKHNRCFCEPNGLGRLCTRTLSQVSIQKYQKFTGFPPPAQPQKDLRNEPVARTM